MLVLPFVRVTIKLVLPFVRVTIMLFLLFVPEDGCLRPAELQHDREVRLAVGADGKREQLVAGTGGVRGSMPEPPPQRVRAPPGSRLRRRHGVSLSHLLSLHHRKYWPRLPENSETKMTASVLSTFFQALAIAHPSKDEWITFHLSFYLIFYRLTVV